MKKLEPRSRLLIAFALTAVAVILASTVASLTLYRTALHREREHLHLLAESQARMISAVAAHDERQAQILGRPPVGFASARDATLSQIRQARGAFEALSRTGEFTLAERSGDQVHFLLRHRHGGTDIPPPIEIGSGLAEPMVAALAGRSGVMIGRDYRGEWVLAAYEPLPWIGAALVAKMDLDEVRRPFVRVAFGVSLGSLLLMGLAYLGLGGLAKPVLARLERTEERLARLLVSAKTAIWEWDPATGDVVWVGDLALLVGREELPRPCTPADLVAEAEEPERLLESLEASRRQESPLDIELKIPNGESGDSWIALAGSWIAGDRGKVLAGYCADATERHAIEDERRRLEEQLQASQRLEAIGRLAGGVAHDFNNLLTVISGRSELMLLLERPDDQIRSGLREIQDTSARAAGLTRQLLAFGRRQPLRPRVISVNEVVEASRQMLERLIGEDIDFRVDLSPDAGNVKVDTSQLEQVILNLVINARDAMSGGGTITLETRELYLDEEYAGRHEGVEPGPHVLLAVSDTGVGMTEEVRRKAFEPFFTTRGDSGGSGMGLATVHGIVRQSGGTIWLYSEPGTGTTFKIYLPRVPGPAEAVRSPELSLDQSRGHERILVVEDEKGILDLTLESLASLGYRPHGASTGRAALKILNGADRDFDLLLTDVVLPGMNGGQLAREAKALVPDLEVLYMSGYTDNVIVHRGMLDPGLRLLQKPFSLHDLGQAVRSALDGG